MKKLYRKLLAILLIIIIMTSMFGVNVSAAPIDDLLSQISAADLTASVSGSNVVVTGAVSNRGLTLRLDIPSGVTVSWQATFRGTANPLIDYYGEGVFEVAEGAFIQNTSSANSFTTLRANGNMLEVRGGVIQAGKGRAIEGAGANTTVTVASGSVTSEAVNNLFPVIDMTHAGNTGLNVIMSGGEVSAIGATAYGYGIQTYGNILIEGGTVSSDGAAGRGINLIGMDSNATVTGGSVIVTGSGGVAISTSSTNPASVTRTSVTIQGGFVASYATGNGWAVRTTGTQSVVTVGGGCVFAFGNNVAYGGTSVTATATNSVIFTQSNQNGFVTALGDGVVIAWDRHAWNTAPHNREHYFEGDTKHIIVSSMMRGLAEWIRMPTGYQYDGISYGFGAGNEGFIPVAYNYNGVPEYVEVVAPFFYIRTVGPGVSDRTIIPYNSSPGVQVPYGGSQTFTITPEPGYAITNVQVFLPSVTQRINRPSVGAVSEYTFEDVTSDYVILVTFGLIVSGYHFVTAYAGTGGSISPSGTDSVLDGTDNRVYTIMANAGYRINDVRVDGESVLEHANFSMDENGNTASFTFPPITRNSVISVSFVALPNTITVTAGVGGAVVPFGDIPIINGSRNISVPYGDDSGFIIEVDDGYFIDHVLIDGVAVMPGSVHEFINVTTNHTIDVRFARNVYHNHIVVATTGSGGTISPQGSVAVPEGGQKAFVITPNFGFRIKDVLVNGVSVGARSAFAFEEVRSDQMIYAEFERIDDGKPPPTPPPPTPPPPPTSAHYAYLIGYTDGTVQPHSNISRAEVATIFFRLISDEYRAEIWSQENLFSDVAFERWYNNSISTMANDGLLLGYSDGTFRPNKAITRAEFATIVARFMNVTDTGGSELFADVSGHWAVTAINSIAYGGWVNGYPDGTFRPDNLITRAETAAIINRIFSRTPETSDDLLPNMISWTDNADPNTWYYKYIQEATNSHLYEMKEDGICEKWTELIPSRDWTVLQRPNSTPWCIAG